MLPELEEIDTSQPFSHRDLILLSADRVITVLTHVCRVTRVESSEKRDPEASTNMRAAWGGPTDDVSRLIVGGGRWKKTPFISFFFPAVSVDTLMCSAFNNTFRPLRISSWQRVSFKRRQKYQMQLELKKLLLLSSH
jgi:hypothetical protein